MIKDYLLGRVLPYLLPFQLAIGTTFLIIEYVKIKPLFTIGWLLVTNIQVLCFVPLIVFIIYVNILNYFLDNTKEECYV